MFWGFSRHVLANVDDYCVEIAFDIIGLICEYEFIFIISVLNSSQARFLRLYQTRFLGSGWS
jgi:hypothetical protein